MPMICYPSVRTCRAAGCGQNLKPFARTHLRVADRRRDFLHTVSSELCRENRAVAIEGAPDRGILANHRWARRIADQAFGQCFVLLHYHADGRSEDGEVSDTTFVRPGRGLVAANDRVTHESGADPGAEAGRVDRRDAAHRTAVQERGGDWRTRRTKKASSPFPKKRAIWVTRIHPRESSTVNWGAFDTRTSPKNQRMPAREA